MNIIEELGETKRQTTAEEVFESLRADIVALRIAPGTKLSEVEVAKNYSVSRQPVREAFMRLGDLSLLLIRPQRATLVRKISMRDLDNTRFIRAAVEVEVIRHACKVASEEAIQEIEENLRLQEAAVAARDPLALRELDYDFHRLICVAAGRLPAFKTIAENKTHTDRVCTFELADTSGMDETLFGHKNILSALRERDETKAVKMTRVHLAHLDTTIEKARQNHQDYFEA
tara:strand:+ start:27451 stop:28140 length:690 start_codon:yes stop_codon:yes gene_type:complete